MKLKKSVTVKATGYDIAGLVTSLNNKYGEGSAYVASDMDQNVEFLSTGIVRLDIATGGGIPEGRQIEIYGNESAGKSTLMLSCIAQFQKKHPDGLAAVIDIERSFDPKYAAYLGVDISRLILINPDNGEQASDLLDEVLTQMVDILVGVDSIAAMTPTKIISISAEQATMGNHAQLINRAVTRTNARMKRNLSDPSYPRTTVLWLNQMREKITMFGNPETTPGGKGKNYYSSLRLKLSSSGTTANKQEQTIQVGGIKKSILLARVVSFSVIKNKTGGTPFEDGEYLYFIKAHKGHAPWTFDNEEALYEAGLFHGVISLNGSIASYGKIRAGKPHLFYDALRANPSIYEKLYRDVMKAVKHFNSSTTDDSEVEPEPSEADEVVEVN